MKLGRVLLLLVLLAVAAPGWAQRLSATTRRALVKWRHSRMGRGNGVGTGIGVACPDTIGGYGLCQATNAELLRLTRRRKPNLRSYAFGILVQRRAPEVFPLLQRHLRDRGRLWVLKVHVIDHEWVGDYWLDLACGDAYGPDKWVLTPDQRAGIDSLLLFQPGVWLSAKSRLLRTLPPALRYYPRVRHLARRPWNFPEALLPLGRYQQAPDVALIRRSLGYRAAQGNGRGRYALQVARQFPQAAYYPKLRRLFARNLAWKYYSADTWQQLLEALVQYPRPETVALLQQVFQAEASRRERLLVPLQAALLKYPHPQWAPLQAQLQLSASQQEELKQYLARPD